MIGRPASEQRHAGQLSERCGELVLKADIRCFSRRGVRSAMMPVSTANGGSGIVADGEPRLSEISHLEIVRRARTAHFRSDPPWIDGVAQNIRPAPGDGEGERGDVQLAL